MGNSDDAHCDRSIWGDVWGCVDDYVPFEVYASNILEILQALQVKKFIPVGALKGSNPALALADLAVNRTGQAPIVDHLVLILPDIASPSAYSYMVNKFIPSISNLPLDVNGSQVDTAWNDPSAAPFGMDGKPISDEKDLDGNEDKTIDFLRSRPVGRVGLQRAWLGYNNAILPALERVSQFARLLIIESTHINAEMISYGLDPSWAQAQMAGVLKGRDYSNITLGLATEGLMVSNSTLMAQIVEDFVMQRALV